MSVSPSPLCILLCTPHAALPMTPSFDLLGQPWLPLRPVGGRPGGPLRWLGLRDALALAHEVEEIVDASPVVVAGLNRLLLALVLSAYRGVLSDEVGWAEAWAAGRFDVSVLDAYLARHTGRFDLFSETHPFFGHPVEDVDGTSPVARLLHDRDSGNNPVFFNHALDANGGAAPPGAVARWLVAHQQFAIAGGVSKPFRLAQGPLVGQLTFWLRGATLFESLMLNAPPLEAVWGEAADVPAWERPAGWAARARVPLGLRDRLTWQSRRVRLLPDARGHVGRLVYAQGDKLDGALPEPFAATRTTDKGTFPLRMEIKPDSGPPRALWRDAALFLTDGRAASSPPRTMAWLANEWAAVQDATPPSRRRERGLFLEADALGLANHEKNAAKLLAWRHERVRFYPALMDAGDPLRADRAAALAEALAFAEGDFQKRISTGAARLIRATHAYATRVAYAKPLVVLDNKGREVDTVTGKTPVKEWNALASALGAEPRFWDALEEPFFGLLNALAGAGPEAFAGAVEAWKKQVRRTAFDVLEEVTSAGRGGSRHLLALVEASVVLAFGRLHPSHTDSPDTAMTTRPEPFRPSERAVRLATRLDQLLGRGQPGFEPDRAALAALRTSYSRDPASDQYADLPYLAAEIDGSPVLPFTDPYDASAWEKAARLTAQLGALYAYAVGLGPERVGGRPRLKLLPSFHPDARRRSLGATLRVLRPDTDEAASALDARVRALLDAHPDDWADPVRRLLQLAAAADAPLDLAALADDLAAAYDGQAERVRRKWAFEYWLPSAAYNAPASSDASDDAPATDA